MKAKQNLSTFAVILAALLLQTIHAQDLARVRYMPHWLHQAQFAGFYMAKEKGYYTNLNLDVIILDGGPTYPVKAVIEKDLAEFTSMFLSRALEIRHTENMPIVNLCQLSQKSALVFVARKSSGIEKIADFNGKKLGVWRSDFQELPKAFLRKYDLAVEVVPITSTINLFLSGGLDIMTMMWYNEYHQLYEAGIDFEDLNVFFFIDYDLNFPEDGIYCREETYNKHPDICARFVQATIEGWKYAFKNKEETLGVVIRYMKHGNIPVSKAHQRWMLNRMEDILTENGNISAPDLKKADYLNTANTLFNQGAITKFDPYEEFFVGNKLRLTNPSRNVQK
ncbi:MAG: ABC transporter substrate-binding protein [Bacteroidales bacterium]|nr:ABC transporter substrate-binding protein [Bacteroidales bacterium]MDZ4205106.1 ABC transporter substrate-binding protein [Bacteroidales bacterium]